MKLILFLVLWTALSLNGIFSDSSADDTSDEESETMSFETFMNVYQKSYANEKEKQQRYQKLV